MSVAREGMLWGMLLMGTRQFLDMRHDSCRFGMRLALDGKVIFSSLLHGTGWVSGTLL